MSNESGLKADERLRLLEELHARYAVGKNPIHKFTYQRKKYAWLITIWGAKLIKRILDFTLSFFGLILLSPLMLLISLLIKITDGGPVFYVTKRVGKWGQEFSFPKFRSMHLNADQYKKSMSHLSDDPNEKRFKIRRDPRITWIGRIIRRTSLDELPQLWCVLIGDMSLVGPRPPLPDETLHYTLEDRRRLDIKPGLTCFWQVEGRSDIPFEQQVQLDVQYVESQSLLVDIKLLLKTIPAIILGKGAY